MYYLLDISNKILITRNTREECEDYFDENNLSGLTTIINNIESLHDITIHYTNIKQGDRRLYED